MNKSILLVYKSVGPYHIARLRHVTRSLKQQNVKVNCLILAGTQSAYAWKSELVNSTDIDAKVLFPSDLLEEIPLLKISKAVVEYVRYQRPDLVFTANYETVPMFLAAMVTRLYGGSAVSMSDTTAMDRERKIYKEKLKKIALLPHRYGFVAGSRSREYLESLGIRGDCIVDGCDVVDNQEFSRQVEKFRINPIEKNSDFLCVARMVEEKNMFNFLSAYKMYRDTYDHARLRNLKICGDGPLLEELVEFVKQKQIEGVSFEGYVNPPKLYEYFANAYALILPSISESWGLVVNEAMASGIPVLVSNRCGCVPELVDNGKTGWVFSPLDVDDISRALKQASSISEIEHLAFQNEAKQLISHWDLEKFTNSISELVKISSRAHNRGGCSSEI